MAKLTEQQRAAMCAMIQARLGVDGFSIWMDPEGTARFTIDDGLETIRGTISAIGQVSAMIQDNRFDNAFTEAFGIMDDLIAEQ